VSDVPQGPGWWQASDGLWYSPDQLPGGQAQPGFDGPQGSPTQPGWGAPGPAYPTMGYGQPVAMGPQNEPLAVPAMVCGIISIPLLCFCGVGVLPGIAALVLGLISKNKIKASNGALTGDGQALTGVICGAVSVVLIALYFVLVIVLEVFTASF